MSSKSATQMILAIFPIKQSNASTTNKPLSRQHTLPTHSSQTAYHIMMRSLITPLLLATAAHGFGAINPAFHVYQGDVHPAPSGVDGDTIDYDAPVERLQAAGHLVEKATSVLDHEIVVDDDCYLGKDGSLDECADFDPPAAMRSDLRDHQAKKYAGLVP